MSETDKDLAFRDLAVRRGMITLAQLEAMLGEIKAIKYKSFVSDVLIRRGSLAYADAASTAKALDPTYVFVWLLFVRPSIRPRFASQS